MKALNITFFILFTLLLVGCASTSDFSKRKYTKGKFRLENNLKKYRGSSSDDEKSISMEKGISLQDKDSVLSLSPSLAYKEIEMNNQNTFVAQKSVREEPVQYEVNTGSAFSLDSRTPIKEESDGVELEFKPDFTSLADTVRMELNDDEVYRADRAQRWAKVGRILIIIGGILLFGFVTTGLGLLLMLIGLGFTIASLVSMYNTGKGRRMAWFNLLWFFLFLILVFATFILIILLFAW